MSKRFGMENCKSVGIPLQPYRELDPDPAGEAHDPSLQFQEIVGALLFVTRCCRPHVSYAVNKLSRYFQNYEKKHMDAAKEDTSMARVKREPVTFILCLLVAAAAGAGIGMGIYLSHEVNELEISQLEIERTLDDLENKVMQNSAHIKMLQDEIKKMSFEVNKLIQDINLFREKIIEIQYLVSYISSRLLIGRGYYKIHEDSGGRKE
ncbi:unnamed protein product [Allacma fusca]|uniref:Uncharacterized protein n=1 Tax=Allacma fusca TaxID=39272 RepID=A0A8J2PYD4_9HEXA|nr:unnamed protein product [Allacma fusca]